MNEITVLKVERGKEPYPVTIKGTDSWDLFCNMRDEINAELAEVLMLMNSPSGREILAFIDEEGKIRSREYCRGLDFFGSLDFIAGTFLTVAHNAETDEFQSLTEDEINFYKDIVWKL